MFARTPATPGPDVPRGGGAEVRRLKTAVLLVPSVKVLRLWLEHQ